MAKAYDWERARLRRQQQREYQLKESAERAKIYPLRIAVNAALKRSGIKHSKTYYSSMVKGWPMSTSEGWETESVYWAMTPYIRVSVTARIGGVGSKYDEKRDAELRDLAEKALAGFEYKKVDRGFEVYAVKS